MIFNIFRFESKDFARKFLQSNHHLIQNKSSVYLIDSFIYIGIVSIDLISNEGLLKAEFNYEQMLHKWCYSELFDNVEFAKFENSSEMKIDSSLIVYDGKNIFRSFQPLSNLMLILNATPDSFSDGGKYKNIETIAMHVSDALNNGVKIIDVGAESTRPNAIYVSSNDEIIRLELIIDKLVQFKQEYDFQISLDTYKPEVAQHFFEKVDIVNDVSNKISLDLIKDITTNGKKYILMHSLTIPADPNIVVSDDFDVIAEILEWFKHKIIQYIEYGINLNNIILDVGIGFNKTAAQSWCLLRNIEKFYNLGCEVLVGHSRKSFLNNITKNNYGSRDLETAIVSNYLANKYVDYLRIHEYKEYLLINNVNNNLGIR
ncbi:MAG: dihydropteroate synthase [Burkholderiales bacterium]|nr:dihydropteroate synthase [Burkholderiales bacterium]